LNRYRIEATGEQAIMIKIVGVVSLVTLAGCATASQIVPMGRDSYLVTAPETLGGTGRILVAKSANQYCESGGTHMIVRRLDANGFTVSLIFSCVSADDPEYKRPNLRKDPNVIIQDQQR
jgi:hypothetical protein